MIFLGLALSWLVYKKNVLAKENKLLLINFKNIEKKNHELEIKFVNCVNNLN